MAPPPVRPDVQSARFRLAIGKHARVRVRVDVTPAGLLAIGGLVAAILLSSATIVAAARRP